MTIRIKSVSIDEENKKILSTYEIKHCNSKTILVQDVVFISNMRLDEVSCEFKIIDFLEQNTFEEAKEKLADWLERLASGLREPTKLYDIPMYSGIKDISQ